MDTALAQPHVHRRVLMAEHDREFARHLISLLRIAGVNEITCVYDGRELLEQLAHSPDYALLVVDDRVARSSGLELVEMVRATGYAGPLLLLSAFADPTVAAQVEAHGGVELISKPFSPQQLINVTHALLGDDCRARAMTAPLRSVRADTADPA